MTGKDQRSRHARRATRQASKDLAEVATQVAQAAVDGEADVEALEARKLQSTAKEAEAGAQTPQAAAEGGDAAQRALLQALPTPARRQATPKAAGLVSEGHSSSQGTPVAASATARPGVAAALPPRGPEPWGLADPSAPPVPAQRGGYREWLQARGQQAMQRSRLRGAAPGSPLAAAGAPLPPPGWPAQPSPATAWPASAVAAASAAQQAAAVHAAWGAAAGELQAQQAALAHQVQPWLGAPGAAVPPMLPITSRQVPPQAPPLQPAPVLADGSMQQVQPPFGGYQPAPVSSPAGQQTPAACGSPYIQEELMAALMPNAFAMDGEQIAEQLRAAAPCCYDD